MRKQRENPLEQAFVKTLKEAGIRTVKIAFPGTAGGFDRLVLAYGYHCWIEFKRDPSEKLSAQQVAIGKLLRRAGMNTAVIKDREEAKMMIAMLILLDKSNRA